MKMTAIHPAEGGAPVFRSAADIVADFAAQRPDATALDAACGKLSYAALHEQAGRLAAHLAALGVGPEKLVAICLDRSHEAIVAALAVWQAGGGFLPLDPAWPDERLRALCANAGLTAIVSKAPHAARLGETVAPLVALDADAAAIAAHPGHVAGPTAPEQLAYVIYTSGSTGEPKGVEISHANLAALIAWHNAAFAVTEETRAAHLAGLGFDASVWEIWPYLTAGACVVLIDEAARTDPAHLHRWLIERRIDIAFAPPALAEPLLDMDWPVDARLRTLLTGADTLHRAPPAHLPFALVNNYGPTESTVVATSGVIAPGSDVSGLPSIGKPIDGTFVRLLDADMNAVAPGEIGEIFIGGAQLARGYRGRPDLTAERFVVHDGERLYRTGDLASWRADGDLAFHGRADGQAKVRGHRVEPDEVAATVARHPALAAAAVATRNDSGETQLVAYIVPAGEAPSAEDLRAFCAQHLPDYMVPSAFVRMAALPLTANGKLDRKALPAPGSHNALTSAATAAAETPAQARLLEILEAALGRTGVGIDDNFFLLGGHSLLGTQVVLRANEAFGVDLQLRDLFMAPTIRQLAAKIEEVLLAMLDAMSEEEAQARAAE
ncbi:MAG: non-ribosomal peptide synthetase [Sphingomonadaceae bacterium]|nr:non-ribosomal peptide synthetase [Sphingomonadaceae bacterium]